MDIGRNDPCLCGSGKKYKRCCGAPKTDPMELAAGAVRAIQDAAEAKVIRLMRAEIGDDAFSAAWSEFSLGKDLDPEHDEADLFVPWALHDWEPWEADRQKQRPLEVRFTPAAGCIAGRGVTTSPNESDFLVRVALTPASFHDVIATAPGRTTTLRDIFLGTELTVFEKLGSMDVRPGDILFGRVVAFDQVALMIGSGQFVLPPRMKGAILDAKAKLRRRLGKLTAAKLCRAAERALRHLYFDLREQIVNPAHPVMCNTDGDPMEFHTLTYKIVRAAAAVSALAPLAGDGRERVLTEANRDRPGGATRVTFSWTVPGNAKHGGMPSTAIADFHINGTALSVQVNSAKRAKMVQAEIAKRLGDQAMLVLDEPLSMDEMFEAAKTRPESKRERVARKRDEELQALPEVQAMLAKMNADHYATWPDVPLPALKGNTPRSAMKTTDGRERVEALIADFERSQNDAPLKMPRYDFNQLRAALRLPQRNP